MAEVVEKTEKKRNRVRIDRKTKALRDVCENLSIVSEQLLELYEMVNDAWSWAVDEIPNRIEVPLPNGYKKESEVC